MIKIMKCPRLGRYGWAATVTVDGRQVDILRVGTFFDIRRAAEHEERRLQSESGRSVATARDRQQDVRRRLWGMPA
ncbi:MAG TPA: hypothetical protein VNL74_03875 [Methylococcus sp.]|nr:hypothetical protein [Methylococcus sp.]